MRRRAWLRAAVGVISIAAIALVVPPIIVGVMIERAYARLIERAQASTPGLQVEGRYRRGLFSSEAHTSIRSDSIGSEGSSGGDPIELVHEFSHGPIPLAELAHGILPAAIVVAVIHTKYFADADTLPRIAAASMGRPLLRSTAWLGLDGALRIDLTSPSLTLEEGDAFSGGFTARTRFTAAGEWTSGELAWQPFGFRDGSATVRVGDGRLDFTTRAADPVASRTATLRLGAVEIDGPAGLYRMAPGLMRVDGDLSGDAGSVVRFTLHAGDIEARGGRPGERDAVHRLRGLELAETGEVDRETGLRHFETEIRFEAFETETGAHGPGHAKIVVRNVDPVAVRGLSAALADILAESTGAPGSTGVAPAMREAWLARLVAQSPEVVLETLSVESPSGALGAHGRASIDGRPAESGTGDVDAEPTTDWLARAHVRLSVEAAPELVADVVRAQLVRTAREDPEMAGLSKSELLEMTDGMTEAAVVALVARGLLLVQGDRFAIELEVADGAATINGQPLDPDWLAGAAARR